MKRVRLIVRQVDIGREFPEGMALDLSDVASVLDVLGGADRVIRERLGGSSIRGCRSLLQLVYHPFEKGFYSQVAVQAFTRDNVFLGVRENPDMVLPDCATVILVPEGGCSTDWEEPVKWEG